MATFPQLLEDDIQQLDSTLRELLAKSDATTALVIDKGGFLITHQGDAQQFDLTTIGALASGAYLASQTIANLVHESSFDSVYQQGEKFSLFVSNVDEHSLLVVIFRALVGVGIVKYYATLARAQIAQRLKFAQDRDPAASLDLSVLNLVDTSSLFKKQA